MDSQPERLRHVERFNPRSMSEHEVEALAVGYEEPLSTLIGAVEEALRAREDGKPLRQIFLAAPRGHGKSFLARLLQIALLRSHSHDVLMVSMPEENYGIELPHHLLRRLTELVSGHKKRDVPSHLAEETAWADPVQARRMWDEELAGLWFELDNKTADRGRILVANLENLHLHEDLFRPGSIGLALLQELLNSPENRLVLFGSTSRAVKRSKLANLLGDPIQLTLRPWSPETCVRYFEKQSLAIRGHGLRPDETPRSYAVARFINGTPRLAATIGLSLLDRGAFQAADTLRYMASDLTSYYQDRIRGLSRKARQLFGLMVEVGQPRTQADLTRLAGYASGNALSGPFRELKDELLFVSRSDAASASLLQISDSIMAFWYAMREDNNQFGDASIQLLLEYMVDFYSPREWEEVAQAAVNPAHRQMAKQMEDVAGIRQPALREGMPYAALAFESGLIDLSIHLSAGNAKKARGAIADLMVGRFRAVQTAAIEGLAVDTEPSRTFWSIMTALADGLDGRVPAAELALEKVILAAGDRSVALLAASILAQFQWNITRDTERSISTIRKIAASDEAGLNEDAMTELASQRIFVALTEDRYSTALRLGRTAISRARRAKQWRGLSNLHRLVSFAQARLGNFAAAAAAADESIKLGKSIDSTRVVLLSLSHLGTYQFANYDFDSAIASLSEAIQLGSQIGAEAETAENLWRLADAHLALGETDHNLAGLQAAEQALVHSQKFRLYETEIEARTRQVMALRALGRHDEAVGAAGRLGEICTEPNRRLYARGLEADALFDAGRPEAAISVVEHTLREDFAPTPETGALEFLNTALWIAGKTSRFAIMPELVRLLNGILATPMVEDGPAQSAADQEAEVELFMKNLAVFMRVTAPDDVSAINNALVHFRLSTHLSDGTTQALGRIERFAKKQDAMLALVEQARSLNRIFEAWPRQLSAWPFRTLLGDEAAGIISVFSEARWLESSMDGFRLTGVRIWEDLPFQPGVDLVELAFIDSANHVRTSRALAWADGARTNAAILNGTNAAIYTLNDVRPIDLSTTDKVQAYVEFFFSVVLGQLGSFRLLTSDDQIPFVVPPSENVLQAVRDALSSKPLLKDGDDGGIYYGPLNILFDPANRLSGLFKSFVTIDPTGNLALVGETLLMEDLVVSRRACIDDLYEEGLTRPDDRRVGPIQLDTKSTNAIFKTANRKRIKVLIDRVITQAGGDFDQLIELAADRARRFISSDQSGAVGAGGFLVNLAARVGSADAIARFAEVAKAVAPDGPAADALRPALHVLQAARQYVEAGRHIGTLDGEDPNVAMVVSTIFGPSVNIGSDAAPRVNRAKGRYRQNL